MARGSDRGGAGTSAAFLLLILAQGIHSVEEYISRLWEHLAPARYVASQFGVSPPTGFIISNSLLFLLGIVCWLAFVRPARPSAGIVAWCWGIGEIANGFGHIALALGAGGYFPGLYTAPLLLAAGAWLVSRLGSRDM